MKLLPILPPTTLGCSKTSLSTRKRKGGPLLAKVMAAGLAVLLFGVVKAQAADGFLKESRLLAALVEAGELPPVEERLPRNPVLVDPVERFGRYGGTWRMSMRGTADRGLVYRTIGYEHLLRWDPVWTRVIPNVAQYLSVNEDATEFTFGLREGMRWSDGHPFTADDIMFWYEDVLKNPELTPKPAPWFVAGGRLVGADKLDSLTVRFRFAASKGLFPQHLASGQDSGGPANFPKHWLKRFHRRYNPEGLVAEMEAAGASDWVELFRLKSGDEQVPKSLAALLRYYVSARTCRAVLSPGRLSMLGTCEASKTALHPGSSLKGTPITGRSIQAASSSHIWVAYSTFKSRQEIVEFTKTGNIGMQSRRISHPKFHNEFAEFQAEGGYRFFSLTPANSNSLVIALNLTHPDPAYGNRDFRIALSLAINRKAIIDSAGIGEGRPYQLAPRPESRFYNPRLAQQYTDYDPARANGMLDVLGLERRDDEGFRLRVVEGNPA